MGALGLALIALVGVVLVLTGLPAYAVLIFAAVLGATAAVLERQHPVRLARHLARPPHQSAGERSSAGSAALCLDGRAAQPHERGAGRVSHAALAAPQPPRRSGGGRPGTGCAARSHERIGGGQRSGARACGRAEPVGRRSAGAAASGNDCRCEHAGGGHSTLAGSHTSRRCHAFRAHAGRQRDRTGRSRHQYPGRPAGRHRPRGSLSIVEPGRRLVLRQSEQRPPRRPPRASDDRPGARSF